MKIKPSIVALIAALGISSAVSIAYTPTIRRSVFLNKWSRKLALAKNADDVAFLSAGDRPNLVIRNKMASGEWIVFVNSSIDGGNSFNATICIDSDSVVRWSDFEFSGYEGLEERIFNSPKNNLLNFWKSFERYNWKTLSGK